MEQLRLFISLPLDFGLAKKLHKQFNQLELPKDGMRLVLPDQMHLALKFLGAVPLDKLPTIISSLENIKSSGDPIDLSLGEVVASPSSRPEVIFIRVKENEDLTALYNKIEQNLFASGLANLESRKFTPHLTLARIKTKIEPEQLAPLKDWKVADQFAVNYFYLMQSELTPKGPIYTNLQSFDL
jgi:RNA 2',3'-cyclic 3'-phosphodiesterase